MPKHLAIFASVVSRGSDSPFSIALNVLLEIPLSLANRFIDSRFLVLNFTIRSPICFFILSVLTIARMDNTNEGSVYRPSNLAYFN